MNYLEARTKRVRLEEFVKTGSPQNPADIRIASHTLYPGVSEDIALRRTLDLIKQSKKKNPGMIKSTNTRNRHRFYYWEGSVPKSDDVWLRDSEGEPIVKLVTPGNKVSDGSVLTLTPHQINIVNRLSWDHPTSRTTLIQDLYDPRTPIEKTKNALSKEIGRIRKVIKEVGVDITNPNRGGNEHEEASYIFRRHESQADIEPINDLDIYAISVVMRAGKLDFLFKEYGIVFYSEDSRRLENMFVEARSALDQEGSERPNLEQIVEIFSGRLKSFTGNRSHYINKELDENIKWLFKRFFLGMGTGRINSFISELPQNYFNAASKTRVSGFTGTK